MRSHKLTLLPVALRAVRRRAGYRRAYARLDDWLLSYYDSLLRASRSRVKLPLWGRHADLRMKGSKDPITLRLGSSDRAVLEEVFLRHIYKSALELALGAREVPYMIVVYKVRPEWKERLSASTHEDGTDRVQTVTRSPNELYYDLLSALGQRTGVPVLLNTSFNENEPIVHTPEQAIDCFARTKMDALGVGAFWLTKGETAT